MGKEVPVIASPLQSGKSRFVKFGRNLMVEVKEKGIVFASYFCKAKIAWQSNRWVFHKETTQLDCHNLFAEQKGFAKTNFLVSFLKGFLRRRLRLPKEIFK